MTEKVKITQEQDQSIKTLVSDRGKERVLELHVIKDWELERNKCLNEIPTEDMARILYEWDSYEIEPEYKVGDWVVCTHLSSALKIIAIQYENSRVQYMDVSNWQPIAGIGRHATPEEIVEEKERRKWAEIEVGDVLRIKDEPQAIGMFKGEGAEGTVLVETLFGAVIWLKPEIELYAKKVGEPNATTDN